MDRFGEITIGYYGYRVDEVEPLAEAMRAHSVDARAEQILAGGGGGVQEVLVIISLGAGIGLAELCKQFFAQAYDTWLRDPLASTLFRQDEKVIRKPRLELKGIDITASLDSQDLTEIDSGMKMLPEALEALEHSDVWERAEKPAFPSVSYAYGTWRVHGRRNVYAYRPGTKRYEVLPREQW